MPRKTPSIECPRCGGFTRPVFKGQTLEEALARHEELTHAPPKKPRPAPEALAAVSEVRPIPSSRRVVRPKRG